MNKIIHYIWLGNNVKSKLINKCIRSWQKYFPEWEIKEWNEGNLNLDICSYCRQAYDAKKYAFASDVLRFDILNKYGGLYLDVDVEILKSFEDLCEQYQSFAGFEDKKISPGLVLYSKEPNNNLFKKMLERYKQRNFIKDNGEYDLYTVVSQFTDILKDEGFVMDNTLQTISGFTVFPQSYFCPVNAFWSRQDFSDQTRAMHHYAGTWLSKSERRKNSFKKLCYKALGVKTVSRLKNLFRKGK